MKVIPSQEYDPEFAHSRKFKVVGIPKKYKHDYDELEVQVNYTGDGNASKGVCLDHHIIPLLKAAPDLLEALERAISIIEDLPYPDNHPAKDLRIAAAKARGE